jgi:hydrogenase expression/formation protein HypE
MKLPMGKIPPETLVNAVFSQLGVKNQDVILGPSLGEDGAIVKVGNKVLISAMDPITGAAQRIGWLAVNINANDVATFGVRPTFFSSCVLLTEDSTEKTAKKICQQISYAAEKLGIAIIGGHSEVTPNLNRPIIIGCAMGVTEPNKYVITGGAKPRDKIVLTKDAGIEGTAVLAMEKHSQLKTKLKKSLLRSAASFYDRISVVEEAILAYNHGGVTAMHDPTEGGIAGGIHEIADASRLGVKVFEDKISVSTETSEICEFFNVDPLQLIGSGALLISAKPKSAEDIVNELTNHDIQASVIGEFLDDPASRIIVSPDGSKANLARPLCDHLWLALKK